MASTWRLPEAYTGERLAAGDPRFAPDMARHCQGEDLKIGANLTWEMLGGWSMFVNGDIQTNAQTTFYVGSGGIGCQW